MKINTAALNLPSTLEACVIVCGGFFLTFTFIILFRKDSKHTKN